MNLGSLIGYLGLDTKDWDKGLDHAEGGIKDFAKKGAALAATAGLAIGGAVVGAVVKSMNIEAANDKLAAQLGLTAEESERVGGVAGKLYANAYGENLADVNDAVAAVMSSIDGMSTASSADLEAMTEKALDFATAFEVDVARSTQIAGQMITQGLAKDGTEAFDLLVSASQQVPAAIREDLLDATDEYGGFFADLGYTGPQAMALLVDASEKGMYGIDKLGDAVKEFGILATTDLARTGPVYEQLGMDADEMSNRLLAGGDIAYAATQEIIAGLLGIEDPSARAKAAVDMFGTPLEDLSVQEIPAFLEALQMSKGELENVAGAAARMGDTLNDNAAAKLESFKRKAIDAFVKVVGGKVLPILEDAAEWLEKHLVPALSTAADAIRPFIEAFTSGGDTASGSVGKIQGAIQSLKDFAGPAFQSLKAIFEDVVTIITAVWDRFGDTIVSYFVESWQNIQTVLQGALDVIKGILDVFIGVFTGDWSRVWDGVKGIFSGAWDMIVGTIAQALNIISTAASVFFEAIKAVFSAGWDAIKSATGAAWDWVTRTVSGAWGSLTGAISSGISTAVSFVRELPGKVVGALGDMGSVLYQAGKDMIQGLINGAGSLLANIGRFFLDKLPGWIKTPFKLALGINSPSKVFAGYGANIGQGLIAGMAEMQPAVASQMMKLADTQALAGLMPKGVERVQLGDVSQALWDQLLGSGWKGRAGDEMEALYRPADQPAPATPRNAPLFHADTVNLIEGTPEDIAQQLAYQGRTRGW